VGSGRSAPTPWVDMNDWYKDAVIYEAHVRAFKDSNADGVGDFKGLVEKLDYLAELGVTALWLLPFYPSPLRDDGYDIADFTAVNPAYGTLRDVKTLVREAHERGLRIITELVCNHTSDQHPWFQRARRAKPGSAARGFYVWSDNADRYREARIIFKDFESSNWSWDPVANAYFWHRFYHHQPDLNYDNPAVHRAVIKAMDFWLDMGVDGLRLDAIPYLYEREGTNCENLPETHQFLKKLRRHVDERYGDRMLLAEANQWPEDSVAYFGEGEGDECHMAFHFPVMPRLFMAIRMEDRFPVVDILEHTPPIPPTAQWAMFLRNHDELTLEMVTDEERDYMYRVYAGDPQLRINLGIRRRLAPLLGNHRRRIELMNGLLFSLPGTPVLYYGDELGMGDNPYLGDRNGVRTPMQWSADRNAGFSDANPQRLYLPVIIDPEYHYQTVNVEAQRNNPHSLLRWTTRLIELRRQYRAFSRGDIRFILPENRKVLAFVRQDGDETILVVANMSRFAQYVELDLSAYRGLQPVELFGRSRFPPVGDRPYVLTLGPHAFFWFALEPSRERIEVAPRPVRELPSLAFEGSWEEVVVGRGRGQLGRVLAEYLPTQRWFGAKTRVIRSVRIRDAIPVRTQDGGAFVTLAQVEYVEGDPELYTLVLGCVEGEALREALVDRPGSLIARLDGQHGGVLYDAIADPGVGLALLEAVAGRRRLRAGAGEVTAFQTGALRGMRRASDWALRPSASRAEQSNSSVTYDDQFILKLFRKIEPGPNPEVEIGRVLTELQFEHTPGTAGGIEYRAGREQATLAVLQTFVPNEGDAWRYSLDELARYYDRVAAWPAPPEDSSAAARLLALAGDEPPDEVHRALQAYVERAALLGQRTAEMHVALASATGPDFGPEPFGQLYQRSLFQSLRTLATRNLRLLRDAADLAPEVRPLADAVLALEPAITARFRAVIDRKIVAQRTRIHGDYHLGQVLFTGRDFVIVDFEGEPARPLGERRLKRSPMRDVAGMLRSFHYAAYAGLAGRGSEALEPWARYWHRWASASFLRGYLAVPDVFGFLPRDPESLTLLLDVHLLEKALYELGYELDNRPSWVYLPLRGILQLLET